MKLPVLPLLLVWASTTEAPSTAYPQSPTACAATATRRPYLLSFPEPGLDDPAAYQGYRTRFFRDAAGNTLQVYIKENEGRIVNLWADAANESIGFTVRDAAGVGVVPVDWGADTSCVSARAGARSLEYGLLVGAPEIRIGHFVLGSMRIERDVQYGQLHLQPFGALFVPPEWDTLVTNVSRLGNAERRHHLELLNATSVTELRNRLQPSVRLVSESGLSTARIEQPSLDGRTRLLLELSVPASVADFEWQPNVLRVRSRSGRSFLLNVRLTTNAAPLTPLTREQIFNRDFLAFFDSLRTLHDAAVARGSANDTSVRRFRRLERQVRGLELLSSEQKLMAGLPNFATYFGRDMLVTALLMQPVWSPATSEHVIASVLRKLSPTGEVSHEEALGGQAIREHAQQYNALMSQSFAERNPPEVTARLRRQAAEVLTRLSHVRENYSMVDDEFQFPVLVATYLMDPRVNAERKRAFLNQRAETTGSASRLTLLLRNLALVSELSAAYVRQPTALNLVSFPQRDHGYQSASWRDSNAGYGGGRFAMDVNAIWVPNALESLQVILRSLRDLGYDRAELQRTFPPLSAGTLGVYVRDSLRLQHAIDTWRGAARHFTVRLPAAEAAARIERKLAWLPDDEERYWRGVLARTQIPAELMFQAVSLDARGQPIAIANTDIATRWFLDDITGALLRQPALASRLLEELAAPVLPFPVGLFAERLGVLVANDAFATPEIWEVFRRDEYHSPRVVWGREVNLLLMGLMRQIATAHDDTGQLRAPHLRTFVNRLNEALQQTLSAVEASGLKHNELWSYRIEGDRLVPTRWGSSSDVQLWNLTDLAVQFLLARRR